MASTKSAPDPPKTIIVTGVSPHSPLSTYLVTTLISLYNDQLPSFALLGPSQKYLEGTILGVKSKLPGLDLNLIPLEVDLNSAESIGRVSHTIRSHIGAWDILIHNAPANLPLPVSKPEQGQSSSSGQSQPQLTSIRGSDADTWSSVFSTNVLALHPIARHFFSKMRSNARLLVLLPYDTKQQGLALDDKAAMYAAAALAAERIVAYLNKENEATGVRCRSCFVGQGGEHSQKRGDGDNGEDWKGRAAEVLEALEKA